MANTRDFCNQEGHEHALVPAIVDVRDSLGVLAVQVLAAREDLANMDYDEMVHKLYDITSDLHRAYNSERARIPYRLPPCECYLHSRGFLSSNFGHNVSNGLRFDIEATSASTSFNTARTSPISNSEPYSFTVLSTAL